MSSMHSLIAAAVTTYAAAWNERDAVRRASLLAQALTDDVRIVFSGREIRGRAALDAEIAKFQHARPGLRAVLSTRVDVRGSVCRFVGVVEDDEGARTGETLDVCESDPDGRLRLILSFPGAVIGP